LLSLFVIHPVGAAFERGVGRKKFKKVEIFFHGLGFLVKSEHFVGIDNGLLQPSGRRNSVMLFSNEIPRQKE
jgi:hypothetical protein